MNIERPDLSQINPQVRAYIEALEAELEELRQGKRRSAPGAQPAEPLEPSEPPTTFNVITLTASGLAKRTPRHFYTRQRRGGMGVFDIETSEDDPPLTLIIADESQGLVLITDQARAFRLPVSELPEAPVRSRGQPMTERLSLRPDENPALLLVDQGAGYVILLTRRGHLRRLRYHYFGENLRPGTRMYDVNELGPPAAASWSQGDAELFIATRQGRATRFAERLVPSTGCLGVRLEPGDSAVAVTTIDSESRVFLLGADGKGTLRFMSGFSANKSPGASGKIAIKTDELVAAFAVDDYDDIFAISRLSKIVRFQAGEVPAKEGAVQGVNCMALRGDEVIAALGSPIAQPNL